MDEIDKQLAELEELMADIPDYEDPTLLVD